MQGIELSRTYFETYGMPMLEREFPALLPHIAAGVCGQGSENFGFDDEVSRDHDFDPGFYLWLPQPLYKEYEFRLSRAYDALPEIFMGVPLVGKSVYETARHGVRETGAFFSSLTGFSDAPPDNAAWCGVPSFRFACAVNGEIFYDGSGEVTALRAAFAHPPQDVLLKKIAAAAALAAQAGQYNYPRCLSHGEAGAAMLALTEFVRAAMETIFLLNRRHMPYYKWSLRAMRTLPLLADMAEPLEFLLTGENGGEADGLKIQLVEDICASVLRVLKEQGLTSGSGAYLEAHAFEIQRRIENGAIRALHIMEE